MSIKKRPMTRLRNFNITLEKVQMGPQCADQHGRQPDWEPADNAIPMPTHHAPGTREKIEVLRERLERGQHLWHEHDQLSFAGVVIRGSVHWQAGMMRVSGEARCKLPDMHRKLLDQ